MGTQVELYKRLDWVDIAKGIAIILMVAGHTSIPELLSKWIWSFHMVSHQTTVRKKEVI